MRCIEIESNLLHPVQSPGLTLTWDVLKFLNFLSASSGDGLTLTWDVLKWLGD